MIVLDEIAYCGLNCSLCPAYIATKAQDKSKLDYVAALFSTKERKFSADDVICDGCSSTRVFKWTSECPTRNCAREKQLSTCAGCNDNPCKSPTYHWEHSGNQGTSMKNNLEKLRKGFRMMAEDSMKLVKKGSPK